jgi:hypothetical protein
MAQANKSISAGSESSSSAASRLRSIRRAGQAAAAGVALGVLAIAPRANAIDVSPLVGMDLGVTYVEPQIKSIDNIPLSIRNVPINPEDTYVPAGNQGPISQTSLKTPYTLTILDFKLGAKFDMGRAQSWGDGSTNKWLSASAGIGISLNLTPDTIGNPTFGSNTAERNYSNAVGTSERGEGAALTYEQLNNHYWGGKWNEYLQPFAFVDLSHNFSKAVALSVGVKVTQQTEMIATGWDRWDEQSGWKTYDVSSYYTAMPYMQLKLGPKAINDEEGINSYVSLIGGVSQIISEKDSNGVQSSKNGVPFFIGVTAGCEF